MEKITPNSSFFGHCQETRYQNVEPKVATPIFRFLETTNRTCEIYSSSSANSKFSQFVAPANPTTNAINNMSLTRDSEK